MKIILAFFLIFISRIEISAQDIDTVIVDQSINIKGDVILEVAPVFLSVNRIEPLFGGGFNVQYFISRKINLNGYLVISRKYGCINLGLIGVPTLLMFNSKEGLESESLGEFFAQLFMMIFAFENPSFHFTVNNKTDLSIYAGLLKLIWDGRMNSIDNTEEDTYAACYLGLRFNRYFGRFVLSPFGEVNFRYNNFTPSVNTGIYLGYFIPSR